MDKQYFPSEDVDMAAFNKCFPIYKNKTSGLSKDSMEVNEIALSVAREYYKEGYTLRVIELAEYMCYRIHGGSTDVNILDKKVEPKKPPPPRPGNPYSKFRI